MPQRTYVSAVAVIFTVIAVLHLARVVYGWTAAIGGWTVPVWLSWVALVVAAYLAYSGYRLAKK